MRSAVTWTCASFPAPCGCSGVVNAPASAKLLTHRFASAAYLSMRARVCVCVCVVYLPIYPSIHPSITMCIDARRDSYAPMCTQVWKLRDWREAMLVNEVICMYVHRHEQKERKTDTEKQTERTQTNAQLASWYSASRRQNVGLESRNRS